MNRLINAGATGLSFGASVIVPYIFVKYKFEKPLRVTIFEDDDGKNPYKDLYERFPSYRPNGTLTVFWRDGSAEVSEYKNYLRHDAQKFYPGGLSSDPRPLKENQRSWPKDQAQSITLWRFGKKDGVQTWYSRAGKETSYANYNAGHLIYYRDLTTGQDKFYLGDESEPGM